MIGGKLQELLEGRSMSVRELARRVGVSEQTLHSIIKRDNMKIDLELLLRVCRELDVPVEVFYGDGNGDGGRAADPEELRFVGKYRRLDGHGRELTELVMDTELRRLEAGPGQQRDTRVIPLYLTPAAAGYASPAFGEDYEDYSVPAACRADFAVRISGDSMEPVLADGSVALVKREAIKNGDVGLFFVDGDMKCKQYLRDSFGNVYLFSVNRKRADADSSIPASSGITLCCFGRVLLDRRVPLP